MANLRQVHVIPMEHAPIRGAMLVALSGVLFGCMGYFGTQVLRLHFSIENMLFWRFLIATICIAPGLLLSSRSVTNSSVKNRVSIIKIFILSALSYSGASAFYFLASTAIGTGLAMVLFYAFPVFVALLAWLFDGWRFSKPTIISLILLITGLFLLKGRGDIALNASGIGLAVIAAGCFAAYVYGSQHTTKQWNASQLTLFVCLGNTCLFGLWSLCSSTFQLPMILNAWIYLAALGIISTALPIQLLLHGLKYVSPVKAFILSAFEPVVTLLIGMIMLNETVTSMQLAGVAVILLSAMVIHLDGLVRN